MIVADPHRRPTWAVPALAAIALALGACGPHHRLADFQYPGHTLSVVTESPPSPEFLSGIGRSGRGSTIGRIADVVGRVLTGVDAFGLEAKLDTVSDQVDVTALMEDRLLRRGSRYLGAEPVPGDPHADYILEVHVRSYGIDADGWEDRAWAFVDATAVLL
ncbi:MAG: hypothetical protein OEZ37_03905, partial [Gemmatimonadota bacterium]|nr:hypothetical protein [Gemmatimonadota bacterium]